MPGKNGHQGRSSGFKTTAQKATRPPESLAVPAGDAATASQSFSYSRLSRLTTPAQYQRVFSGAKRSGDRYFTVLYRGNERAAPRLGFAVAKKRIAKAVGRNRIRRLARESFRHERRTLGGIDIIIMARTAAASATNAELFASLAQHWDRLSKGESTGHRHGNKDKKA
ncbi:MAG: ribonuclease P protein component [Chromatiales bacterium]|nr:ribonuclease P protein component [Chromatiales bacterium]